MTINSKTHRQSAVFVLPKLMPFPVITATLHNPDSSYDLNVTGIKVDTIKVGKDFVTRIKITSVDSHPKMSPDTCEIMVVGVFQSKIRFSSDNPLSTETIRQTSTSHIDTLKPDIDGANIIYSSDTVMTADPIKKTQTAVFILPRLLPGPTVNATVTYDPSNAYVISESGIEIRDTTMMGVKYTKILITAIDSNPGSESYANTCNIIVVGQLPPPPPTVPCSLSCVHYPNGDRVKFGSDYTKYILHLPGSLEAVKGGIAGGSCEGCLFDIYNGTQQGLGVLMHVANANKGATATFNPTSYVEACTDGGCTTKCEAFDNNTWVRIYTDQMSARFNLTCEAQ